jgi:aspartyl protease family protein
MLLWLAVLAGIGLLIWGLNRLLPGQVTKAEDWTDVAGATLVLAVVSAGLLASRRANLGRNLRYGAIWAGIFAIFVVGYAYRSDLAAVGQRIRSEFLPAHPMPAGPHALVVTQSGGGYFIMGKVDGVDIRFLIDTGASDIVLSPDDARRLGVDPSELKYDKAYETANGVGLGARLDGRRLEVGPIRMDGVTVSINQAPMTSSLLGMAFLHRLEGFEARDGKLVLRWKG